MGIKQTFYKQYFVGSLLLIASCTAMASEIKADEARVLIKTTAEEVIAHVQANRAALKKDPSQLYAFVNEKISPHVDFTRMSRWILGKHWRKASQDQRSQFSDEFRKLLIRTYATALLKFSGEKMTYPPVKGGVKKGKVSIRSEITLPDGQQFSVQYRMHNKDQDWKIYDISVGGVSLVSTYRSSFATEIRKVGLSGLLDHLETKNKGLNI